MKPTMIQPINDRVIVRLFPAEEIDSDKFPTLAKLGIVAPEIAQNKETICGKMVVYTDYAHRGEVVAVGPGKWLPPCKKCGRDTLTRRPLSVKVGDIVQFGRFADHVTDDCVIIHEDDVVGIEAPEAVSACV